MPASERRLHARIDFVASARVVAPDWIQGGNLKDISLKGALVEFPEPWRGQPDTRYLLEFVLAGSTDVIRMAVNAVHIEGPRVGFHCIGFDLDSAAHLRRLVELNLGSGDLLERELEALSHGGD